MTGALHVCAADARRMIMHGADLLEDNGRDASPSAIKAGIRRLGYVQVDTISTVERAHHHILLSRFRNYEAASLKSLLEDERALFEHWTHDASVVPIEWYPWWLHRFDRYRERGPAWHKWWAERFGDHMEETLALVMRRIEREGPMLSRDFENTGRGKQSWWGWKPAKAALEYLWRVGDLAVARRDNFQKVYDLAERVHPEHSNAKRQDDAANEEWACRAALERLGVATHAEVARYLNAISVPRAKAWCAGAAQRGEIIEVVIDSEDGTPPKPGFALPDFEARLDSARAVTPHPDDEMRLLSPFDPLIRDRDRLLRLFDFDYRFEAFVPAAKRKYGYYVLPILRGDRIIGRVDPKFHRDEGVLVVNEVWWKGGVRESKQVWARLESAVNDLAVGIGAAEWEIAGR